MIAASMLCVTILVTGFFPSGVVRTGTASWYYAPITEAAAGPALRVGSWRGRVVSVCTDDRCIRVRLTDWCQCYKGTRRERIIDLPKSAFARLAHPSRGLVGVKVTW